MASKIRKKAIIFDLDGTLCELYDERPAKYTGEEMSTFLYQQVMLDTPDDTIICIVTGRNKRRYGEITKQWLKRHGCRYDYLFMQEGHTSVKNHIFKGRVLKGIKKILDITMVYDDNPDVEFVCELLDIPITLVKNEPSNRNSEC